MSKFTISIITRNDSLAYVDTVSATFEVARASALTIAQALGFTVTNDYGDYVAGDYNGEPGSILINAN